MTRQRKKDVEEAVFVLSDGARVRYCFCLHFLVSDGELRVDRCYCLVTRHPFARLHFQVLRNANVEQLIDSYAKVSVPDPGDCIVLADLVEWRRPLRNAPPLATVRDWALPKMFAHLTLENLLLVLGCALVELQIIFVSDKHEALSASTLGLASMLAPLNWAGPLISTLPSKMYEYLESPVPSVVGVLSLPCNFRQGCDMVVVFLEQDKVSLPPNIHSRPDSHLSIQLPRLSQLAHDLHSDYKAFRDSSSSSSPYQQPSLEPMTDTSPATDIPNDGSTASSFGSGDNSLQFPLDGDNDITESRPRDAAAFIPQREKKGVAIPPPSSLVNVVANRIEHHLRALVATASELRNEKDAGDSLLSTRGSAQTAFDRPQSADTPPRQTLCDVAPGRCLSPSKLARKECWYNNLGDTCLSYIAKFAETQMFTNYFWSRQRNGVSASKLIAKRTQELMSLMLRGGAYFPVIASIYDTASSSPTEKDLLFCNGRCGGRLNTANCTLLCARLWEERQISNKKPWRKKMPSLSRHPLETRDQLLLRQKLHHRCQISPAKDALRSKRRGLNKSTRVGHGEKIALRHMRRAAEKARARKDRRNAAAALIAVAWTMYNRIRRNYAAVSIQRVARRLKPVLLSCPRPKIERSEELVRGTTNEENLFDGDTKVEIVSNGNTERGMA